MLRIPWNSWPCPGATVDPTVETLQSGPGDHPTVIATTTPTGHTYLSQAPNPP